MTSGCIDRVWDIVEVNDGEEANVDYSKYDNESADNETGNTVESDKNSEKNTQIKTTSTTKTEKKTSTPSKTESCSHPSVTTKYVGMDKATGKVIYNTYCSKCGEFLGQVKY